MPVNDRERDLQALRNLIDEAHLILSTVGTAKGGANAAAKKLASALALTDDLLAHRPEPFRLDSVVDRRPQSVGLTIKKIAAMRKTKAGGRPKSTA